MSSTPSCSTPTSRYPPSKPYITSRPRSPHPEDCDSPQTPHSPFQIPFFSPKGKSSGNGSKPSTPTRRAAPERRSSTSKENRGDEGRRDSQGKESSVKHSKSRSEPFLRAQPARTPERHQAPTVKSQSASLCQVYNASTDRADPHSSATTLQPKSILKSGRTHADESTSVTREGVVTEVGQARQKTIRGEKKVRFADDYEQNNDPSFFTRTFGGPPLVDTPFDDSDSEDEDDEIEGSPTDELFGYTFGKGILATQMSPSSKGVLYLHWDRSQRPSPSQKASGSRSSSSSK